MKKKVLLIFSVFIFLSQSFVLSAENFLRLDSQQAERDNNLETQIEQSDIEEDYNEITDINIIQEKVIDLNVKYEDSKVVMDLNRLEQKIIGEEAVEDVEENIEVINKGLEDGSLVIDENGDIVDKGLHEKIEGQRGRTKIVIKWNYIDVYFSTQVLQAIIIGGSTLATGYCAGLTSGIGIKACGVACGAISGYAGTRVLERYPKGMIFRVLGKNWGLRSQ